MNLIPIFWIELHLKIPHICYHQLISGPKMIYIEQYSHARLNKTIEFIHLILMLHLKTFCFCKFDINLLLQVYNLVGVMFQLQRINTVNVSWSYQKLEQRLSASKELKWCPLRIYVIKNNPNLTHSIIQTFYTDNL